MTHRFPVKEIARQAGASEATVDRVINNRPNVSPQMRQRISDAIVELEAQEKQLSARGRKLFFDCVAEAPTRFTREVRRATESVLPYLPGAVIRMRYHFREKMDEKQTVAILEGIRKRGSHGVILKARDVGAVREAVTALGDKSIPTVTIVTDIKSPSRLAYAGMDNRAAGGTAAFIMAKVLAGTGGTVLATRSDEAFAGEDERLDGFRTTLSALHASLSVVDISGGAGLNAATYDRIREALRMQRDVVGCYSIGGGNRSVLRAFGDANISPLCHIAHDLDEDNLQLLKEQRLDWVLGHDLESDMRFALSHLTSHHGLGDTPPERNHSDIRVVTPFSLPLGLPL